MIGCLHADDTEWPGSVFKGPIRTASCLQVNTKLHLFYFKGTMPPFETIFKILGTTHWSFLIGLFKQLSETNTRGHTPFKTTWWWFKMCCSSHQLHTDQIQPLLVIFSEQMEISQKRISVTCCWAIIREFDMQQISKNCHNSFMQSININFNNS